MPVFAFVEEKERTHAGVGVGRASISRKQGSGEARGTEMWEPGVPVPITCANACVRGYALEGPSRLSVTSLC